MLKHILGFASIGSLLLLAGAGCPVKTNLPGNGSATSTDTPAKVAPSITVSNQTVTNNQVMIDKTITTESAWVVIHLVDNGKPGAIIGQTLVSAGENQLFSVSVTGTLTMQLFAMLHVDKGQIGAYDATSDVPMLGTDGMPVMTKFTVQKPLPETANPNAPAGDKSSATPPGQTNVPSKPLSSDAPVRADQVNAPNIPAPKPEEPKQPAPQEPAVKSFSMTAKMFEFVPSTITVNKGDKVKLTITATDVTHGFSLPDFNVSATLEPNQPKTLEFTADKTGTFSFRCSVFCGDGHSGMTGTLIVK